MPHKNKEDRKKYFRQYGKDHKEERKVYIKQWRQENPDYSRKYQIEHLYGLSHKDWLEIWDSQGGKCAICNTPFDKPTDACVDHNHRTGEIRGLLCKNCNLGIGFLNDDSELMAKAINYLKGR